MPHGSMLKFFEDQGGPEHGGRLIWPGTRDGYPYRGDVAPNLKQEEADKIPLALDYKSRMFRLWEQEEKAAFDEVMDRIVNGWYMQHKRADIWDAPHQHYCVWLEWAQIYGETPHGKHPDNAARSKSNGNGQGATTIRPGAPRQGVPLHL